MFWLGDLNFRVEGFSAVESLRLIEHNYIEKLLEFDQVRATGLRFERDESGTDLRLFIAQTLHAG